MADNYLENRMEEYRSGRLAVKSRSTAAMRRPHAGDELVLRFPPMRVVVIAGGLGETEAATVRAFAGVCCRVAFTAVGSPRECAELAQRMGARYYPGTSYTPGAVVSDVAGRWGGIDVIVDFLTDLHAGVEAGIAGPLIIRVHSLGISPAASPSSVARYILFLSHPDNAGLLH